MVQASAGPLKGDLKGWWSAASPEDDRLVYRVEGESDQHRLQVVQCRLISLTAAGTQAKIRKEGGSDDGVIGLRRVGPSTLSRLKADVLHSLACTMPALSYVPTMLGNDYKGQDCSAARALELIGERWSLLIIRDAIFRGTTQFTAFQRSLGIATNVLTKRLDHFVQSGLMTNASAGRYELTEKGRDLAGVVATLTAWGDRWVSPGPVDFVEAGTDNMVTPKLVRERDGAPIGSDALSVRLRGQRRP